ncbi:MULTISPECIES: MFS transporter [Streptomyces]|uniref:MFS transporter n=1 Tax=Streptomyces TaxID=1883 RepID=UPI002256378A|nr:MFS transporter [Streptomyces sp. NBC_01549]MCX4593244.1 MFS transporter [Streptomyces sp. NBC_01549]
MSNVATKAPPSPVRSAFSSLGQATLLIAAALTTVDAFIVNVALPSIQDSFGVSASTSQFVVSCYGITYAVLLVLGGRFGDRFGRRRLIQIGIAGFTIASLICGFAPNIEMLVAARVLQGAAAALLLPQVLSTIQAALEEPAKTRAISYYGAIGGLSAAVGQLLGGMFVWANIADLGWRPIFLVNVPLGLLAMIGTRLWVPETKATQPQGADLGGTALFGTAVLALLIPLSVGRQTHWPLWTWALFVVSAVVAVVLWRYERKVETSGVVPLIAPSLLTKGIMQRGLLVLGSGFLAFGGFIFVFALAVQGGNGMSAFESGLSMAPMAVGQFLAALRAPKLIGNVGVRTLQIGGVLQAAGLVGLIVPALLWWPHLHFYHLMVGMFLIGAGNGLFVPTVYRTVLSSIPPNQIGAGSGIVTTTQQTTLALGVALLGAVFVGVSGHSHMRLGFIVVAAVFLAVAAMFALFGKFMQEKSTQ